MRGKRGALDISVRCIHGDREEPELLRANRGRGEKGRPWDPAV